jgi:hypothetical protein
MKLDDHGRACLTQALAELAAGRDRAFEDTLWLGFGNEWRPLVEGLVKGRCITIGGKDRHTPAITEEGLRLLERLEGHQALAS